MGRIIDDDDEFAGWVGVMKRMQICIGVVWCYFFFFFKIWYGQWLFVSGKRR